MQTWHISQDATDPMALRISIGRVHGKGLVFVPQGGAYLIYRGDYEQCLTLLKDAVAALEGHTK